MITRIRRKRVTTIDQRIDAIGRMIRAAGRAVADDDPAVFARLIELRVTLDDAIDAAVIGLRRDHTWASIGDALGVTRQACVIRWGNLARDAGNAGPRNRPDDDDSPAGVQTAL